MPMRMTSLPDELTRSQLSPVARPFIPGPVPTAAAPTGRKASHTPKAGIAFDSVGAPVSSNACVTTVNVRPPRTGKPSQSLWPTWLSRPDHMPLAGNMRGEAWLPMAS
jgi:hypothetical protein